MADPNVGSGVSPLASLGDDQAENPLTPEVLQKVMAMLRKNGLQETEEALAREASAILRVGDGKPNHAYPTNESVIAEFETLLKHVDSSYDFFQAEFSLLIFPVFAHCFLKLLTDSSPQHAREFFDRFYRRVPSAYEEQVAELRQVTSITQLNANPYAQLLLKSPFTVKMSRSCIQQLDIPLGRAPGIKNIIKEKIPIEQAEAVSKLKSSIECQMGGILGQMSKNPHRHKVLYGIVRDDVWLAMERRKMRGKEMKDNKKATAAAPLPERIPLPPVNENYREERRKALRDASKMALVTQDSPPSVCMFTALNAHGGVTGCDISDDTTMLALGYGDSTINLFSFDENQKIRRLKEMEELEKIDMDADNLTELLYDDSTAASNAVLKGHGGPVYSVSFSPDKRLLVSSAKDNTIRLWSTDTQKNVVVYRMSMPVWQVQFCNRGYYFCSGGADKTAALWCTDRMHPLRLFPDSFGHVSCVDFHPNCNYIAGGSDDRYVRLWDVLTGTCVRTFTGHRAGVRGVKVSPCGRYIVSVSGDGAVCVWDIAQNRMVGMETRSAEATMGAISFSRDAGSFAVSCGAPSVSVYSIDNLIAAMGNQNEFSFDPKINMPGFNMFSFPTKQTPVLGLHFTRRNLILAVGSFNQ